MNHIVESIKKALSAEEIKIEKVVELLKELREFFKLNNNEPAYVKMIRLAYEDLENNGSYSYLFLEEENWQANLEYFVDLLADHKNKYNREELYEIRQLMDPQEEEEEAKPIA